MKIPALKKQILGNFIFTIKCNIFIKKKNAIKIVFGAKCYSFPQQKLHCYIYMYMIYTLKALWLVTLEDWWCSVERKWSLFKKIITGETLWRSPPQKPVK